MRPYCFLFLALIFIARAQNPLTLCPTNNVCINSETCTCVQDPAAPAGTSPCTLTLCAERICSAACGPNCQCTVKSDQTTNTATCTSTCSCPDVGKVDVCTGAGNKPACQTGSISCVATATGTCGWSPCPSCADAGKTDVCGDAGTKPTCATGSISCTTNPNGVCAWSPCPPCRDAGSPDVCTGAGTKPTCQTGSSTCFATATGACAWSECTTCSDAGRTDVCGSASKPTCSGTLTCTTDAKGGCAWSCPTQPTCTVSATGLCGDATKPAATCDGSWSCETTNGVCGWTCTPTNPPPACYDPALETCNGRTKPLASNVCPNAVFECVVSGTTCGWTARCPTTDPCAAAGACSGAAPATCPTGYSVVEGTSYCKQDATGKCGLFASCTATTTTNCLFTTASGAELCGQIQKPERCLNPNQVVPTGATFAARCASLLSQTPGTLNCQWFDNCVSACTVDAKGLCAGKPKPTTCDAGFYSTSTSPAFECVGSGGDACSWVSRECFAGCKFGWTSPNLPTCGGTQWPCNTVAAEVDASLFVSANGGLAGSTVQISASRVASLCTQTADGRCNFPPITCPTQKCFAQLLADGSISCGGKKLDPTVSPCTGSQILASAPVCVESANAASGCDWKFTCTDPINTVTCLKDTARRTCGGNVVPDTCATGTVFTDFDCKDDPVNAGKCLYQARCTSQTQCSANYDACANLVRPTCAATETQVAAPLCCSSNGKSWFEGIKCAPTDPCTTCAYDAAKTLCPAGQTMVAPPTCIRTQNGGCELTAPKCTNASSNCDCKVLRPCSFGQKQVSVKCDPTLCYGVPECVADTCTGNDPCKCDSTKGCVWVTSTNAAGTASKSFCVDKASYTVNLGSVGLGSKFCQVPTSGPTPVKDPVVGAVSDKTFTQTTLSQAIAEFIAALKLLETKLCTSGIFCGLDFSISIFAVAAPVRGSDGSLTVSVTLLFSNRDPTSTATPSQAHFDLYTAAIKKLLARMTGFPELEFENLKLNFAVSGKRALSQTDSQANDASVTVPSNTVNKYYGSNSASSSLVSGLFFFVFVLVAMFFY